jgi:hypothetical protein
VSVIESDMLLERKVSLRLEIALGFHHFPFVFFYLAAVGESPSTIVGPRSEGGWRRSTFRRQFDG